VLGERVIEGDTVTAKPAVDELWAVLDAKEYLRGAADRYVSAQVNDIKADLQAMRHEETTRELENLDAYAQAERERIESFIEEYDRKAEGGADMDIAIRGQQ
jgi:ABC-type phosphate transport system auxiliary subunit